MGIDFSSMGMNSSSDTTLKCGSGTKRVNDECVPDYNVELFEILQKSFLRDIGSNSKTKIDCEYLGGQYTPGSTNIDRTTGFSDISGSRCEMPPPNLKDLEIAQQELCGRKVNSEAKFCTSSLM